MADNTEGMDLTIGLKVDVSAFEKEWEANYRKQIQKKLDASPVSLRIDAKGIENISAEIKKIQQATALIKPSSVSSIISKKIEADAKAAAISQNALTESINRTTLAKASEANITARTQGEEIKNSILLEKLESQKQTSLARSSLARQKAANAAQAELRLSQMQYTERQKAAAADAAELRLSRQKALSLDRERAAIERKRKAQESLNAAVFKEKISQMYPTKQDGGLAAMRAYYLEMEKSSNAQARATAATQAHNSALRTQKGILNGMPQFLNAYISVLGATRLVNNIRQVTAEFELQRTALRAILQDKEIADSLFSRTIQQAVESPFTAKELVTYTKQLAAYRIETEDLFDTTKMLADVSAGLGVSVERLILAYGQVRAASVLRGTELRQFTEAGIPLVDLLAKKFEELEGRAVSTNEVFDMISRRKVPFEYVAEVFQDMTSRGGMFFDMQRKQSETLYGVYQKLGDQLQLSFSEIGEKNMGVLRGAGELALYIAENLNGVVKALTTAGAAWGAYTVSQRLAAMYVGQTNAAMLKEIQTSKLREANALRMKAALTKLSVEELRRIATVKQLTLADVKSIAASNNYTSAVGARLIATKKITREVAMQAAAELQLTQAQIRQLSMLGKWKTAWYLVASGISRATASLKALTIAALSNPFTLLLTAGAALVGLFSSIRRRSKEVAESLAEVTQAYDEQRLKLEGIVKAYDDVTKSINSAKEAGEEFNDTQSYREYFKQLSKLASEYEKLVGTKNVVDLRFVTPENIEDVFRDLQSRYDMAIKYTQLLGYSTVEMGNKIDKAVKKAGEEYASFSKIVGDAEANFGRIGLILRDNYENLSEYEKARVDAFMEGKKEGESDLDYLKRRIYLLRALKYTAQTDSPYGQLTSVWEVAGKNKELFGDMTDYVYDVVDAMESLNKKAENATAKITKAIKDFKEANKGIDFENLTEDQQYALDVAIRSQFSPEDWNDYARELAQNAGRLILGIRVKFSPYLDDDVLTGWRKQFADVLGDEIQKDTSFQQAKQKLISAYKDEKEIYTDLMNQKKAGQPITDKETKEVNDRITAIKALAKAFGIVLEEQKSGAESRYNILMNEVSVVKEAYQQYQKMLSVMGKTDAFRNVDKAFQELFKNFKYLKGVITPTNVQELIKYLQQAIESGVLNEEQKIKLRMEISENEVTDMVNSMKEALSKAKEQIQRSKEANTFYEGLLSSGLGEPIAWQMTMDLYGANPMDIRAQMEKNLREAFKDKLELDLPLSLADAESIVRESTDKIGQETSDMLLGLISDLRNYDAETIKSLQSNLSKTSELEAKRIKIYRDSAAQIAKLQALSIPETQKAAMRGNIEQRKNEQLAALGWEEFKAGDLYTTLFSDLEKVSTASLTSIREKLQMLREQLKDLPADQLKEVMSAISKLDKELLDRDPFSAIVDNIGSLFGGYKRLREAEQEYLNAQTEVDEYQRRYNEKLAERLDLEAQLQAARAAGTDTTALEQQLAQKEKEIAQLRMQLRAAEGVKKNKLVDANAEQAALTNLSDGLKEYEKNVKSVQDAFSEVREVVELVGVDLENTTAGALFDGIDAGLKGMQSMISIMNTIIALQTLMNASNPFGWIAIGVGAIVGAATAIFNAKANRLQKQIEDLEDTVHSLERSYQNLESAAEKALGSDMIKTAKEQQDNLQQQAEAYRKMAELESRKGKKKDEDKMRDYQEQYEDTLAKIQESQDELISTLMGSDLASAARDFAQSWIDAYASFSSTTDAIEEKFREMINNLIVEAIAAKLVQAQLKPIYDAIDKATSDDSLGGAEVTAEEIADITSLIPGVIDGINISLGQLMEDLKQQGIDIQKGESNLTGISAAASSITEDTALTLGAIGNNLVYYVVGIHDLLAARFAMEGVSTDTSSPTLLSVQQAALTELRAIQNNTARSALAAEKLASALSSVISPIGVKSGAKAINVNI